MEGMDFELTHRQKQIRLAAREFAEGEFQEVAREYDRREEFPTELRKKIFKSDYRSNHYR
jgi:alkylation response protein AidB-like acyl-CoA dehydrogenase